MAQYAAITDDALEAVGAAVRAAAKRYGAEPIPIPVSLYETANDAAAARRVIGDAVPAATIATTGALLGAIGRCRVVVTGSYHAGVIALSMGIPVVAVAGSAYYEGKFAGLAGQFGPACRRVTASGADLVPRLTAAIDEAWRGAEDARADLLQAAARQVALGERAYRHVFQLVEARCRQSLASR